MICSFESAASTLMASIASFSFLIMVLFLVSSVSLTSCCVKVLAPSTNFIAFISFIAALNIASRLIPLCSKKRVSSMATSDSTTLGGISLYLTYILFCLSNILATNLSFLSNICVVNFGE